MSTGMPLRLSYGCGSRPATLGTGEGFLCCGALGTLPVLCAVSASYRSLLDRLLVPSPPLPVLVRTRCFALAKHVLYYYASLS